MRTMALVYITLIVLVAAGCPGHPALAEEGAVSSTGKETVQKNTMGGAAAGETAVKPARKPGLEWGNNLYRHYCTPCHGMGGMGNGFNAGHLLVRPANHTDAKFMSARSDQKLFDTINLGGVEVSKSTLMPPWGAALDDDNKIRSLILKLRDLCQCQGPPAR